MIAADGRDIGAGSPSYEVSDVSARAGVLAIVGLLAGLGFSFVAVSALLALLVRSEPPRHATSLETQPISPAGPRLEIAPRVERAAIEAAARQLLDGYGWTDRANRRVHLPIARAMRILADRGWPDGAAAKKAGP